ncbi:DUF1294 domain-containing protein [Anaerosporobacter sp.]|uniref:DUF1294 domain-containing protein n=1 Tax=Anaerosporobacter sp. TaxID=1872529 RepID=UPI00286EE15A|nr:DUF1294 domain-containing protein [Anaerosporobacter sp.]
MDIVEGVNTYVIAGICAYLVIMNIAGFVSMGIDKRRAKQKDWRIPEKTLFFIAIIGGSIGSILGMKQFRHKTKHKTFTIGMPAILLLQICIIIAYVIIK